MTDYAAVKELKVRATGSAYYFRIEVGPVEDDGRFMFGMTAEVSTEEIVGRDGSRIHPVDVSFAAIGAHDTARARVRHASYGAAIAIADQINSMLERGETLARIAEVFDGMSWTIQR